MCMFTFIQVNLSEWHMISCERKHEWTIPKWNRSTSILKSTGQDISSISPVRSKYTFYSIVNKSIVCDEYLSLKTSLSSIVDLHSNWKFFGTESIDWQRANSCYWCWSRVFIHRRRCWWVFLEYVEHRWKDPAWYLHPRKMISWSGWFEQETNDKSCWYSKWKEGREMILISVLELKCF